MSHAARSPAIPPLANASPPAAPAGEGAPGEDLLGGLDARLLQQIVQSLPEGVHLVDAAGVIRWVNPTLEKMLGHPAAALIGQPVADLAHPDDAARVADAFLHDPPRVDALHGLEARLRHRDGEWRMLEMAAVRIQPGTGAPLVVLHSRDITERRRIEEALRASEERYRRFFEDDLTGDFVATVGGRVLTCNEPFVRMLGYDSVAEVLTLHSTSFYADPEMREEVLDRLRREKVIRRLELDLRRKDGETIRVVENLVGAFDSEGELQSFHGYVFDMTEQHRLSLEHTQLLLRERAARAQAEAAERRSAFLAEVGSVLDTSLDYRATLTALARFLVPTVADYCLIDEAPREGGSRRVAAIHRDPGAQQLLLQDDVNPPDADPALHPVVRVLQTGEPILVEAMTAAEFGRLAHDDEHRERLHRLGIRSYMVVPLAARGRILGAVTLVASSSGRRFSVQDLELAEAVASRAALAVDNARLYSGVQQAAQAREEVLAFVSHDLRNPLATVLLNASALLDTITDDRLLPAEREQLEWIARSSEQMNRMIQDLLDVARIESGRLPIRPVELDVGVLLGHVVGLMQPLAAEAGVYLEGAAAPNALRARVDRERVLRVLSNLVGNALKFTPAGGSIRLSAETSGGDVRITVRDTGVGIAPEEQTRIFERYWQGTRGRHGTSGAGNGLGLTIARGIVEAHGGVIWCESRPGEGAAFTFTLPSEGPPEKRG